MKTLNTRLNYAAECTAPPHLRSSECTGTIPAYEVHHCDKRVMRVTGGVVPDDEPQHYFRDCVHCVREYNWREKVKHPILVRIELRYSDGTSRILDGEAAEDWGDEVNARLVSDQLRYGAMSRSYPWREEKTR